MQRFKLTHEKLSEEERKRLKRIVRKPDWLENPKPQRGESKNDKTGAMEL